MSELRHSTADVINVLCLKLGHEEGSTPIIKKLVAQNWLEKADDLRYVSFTRLEKWGVPLKLVHEIKNFINDQEADQTLASMKAFYNYDMRPTLSGWFSPAAALDQMIDGAMRRQNPKEWAAKVFQRFRKNKLAKRQRSNPNEGLNALVQTWLEEGDNKTLSEEKKDERRRKRAEEQLRGFVKMWREQRERKRKAGIPTTHPRRLAGNEPGASSSSVAGTAGGLAALITRRGKLPQCPVAQLLLSIAKQIGRSEEDVEPHVRRLVTLNWLEEVADLDLVEERHWEEWEIPEKLVIEIKAAVRAHLDNEFQTNVINWCSKWVS